jgi:methionyl-tRNA formyltransferase
MPTPQNEEEATYCQLLQKTDAHLDPTSSTAIQIERTIRAHLGFPKSKLVMFGHECTIIKAHVSSIQKTPLDIQCQDGAFICIDELIAPSGRTMGPGDFIRGYNV